MTHMNTINATQLACLEGFIAECARADELGRSVAGRRLLEAKRALDACDDAIELVAVRHWYRAAWEAYATWRGWMTPAVVTGASPIVERAA
jgi:hypothetical protein